MIQPGQARKIRPTRRSVSGIYQFRDETPIAVESTLERDFLVRQEFNLSVDSILAQPVTLTYQDARGHNRPYTPDFLVRYHLDRVYARYPTPILVEVKPEKEWRANWRKWSLKWKAARRYAKEQGYIFRIHDENRIRDNTLANVRFLERFKRMKFPEAESHSIINNVNEMGCATRDYLLARHFMGIYQSQGVAHIWHLLAMRRLDCDIAEPLNAFTELWAPSDE